MINFGQFDDINKSVSDGLREANKYLNKLPDEEKRELKNLISEGVTNLNNKDFKSMDGLKKQAEALREKINKKWQ